MAITQSMKSEGIMRHRKFLQLYLRRAWGALFLCMCITSLAPAQDLLTKGGISGRVLDAMGAAVANAKVTVSGPTGDRVVTANEEGAFEAINLTPGTYTVKAEQSGFKSISVPNVEVYVGKISSLKLTVEAGNITEVVEVSAGAAIVDQSSTTVGANLNDQLYNNIPLQRSVTSLFYLAPGATDSLVGGRANPSISGGSALDNLYIADGVNITDSAFGGLGTFTRNYGSLGTGINTAYIKEVQIKTGGFEPQYGQSQGGIVNIITKSGGAQYHGSFYGYAQPQAFESKRLQPDDVRKDKFGRLLHDENYDTGADIGGPMPGLKERMFFFGSFNPTVRREIVRGAEGSGLDRLYGESHRGFRTLNYAAKLDYNFTPSHTINFSIFGDPTVTNKAPFSTLNIDNATSNSQLKLGTRNTSVRYNGSLSSTWTVSAFFSHSSNNFDEIGFDNQNIILDRTDANRGNFRAIGLGFFEPTQSNTYRTGFDTSKQVSFWGSHTFGVGYQFQKSYYAGTRDRSGPKYKIPGTNADGTQSLPAAYVGQTFNADWNLRLQDSACTACPLLTLPNGDQVRVALQLRRGEFGGADFDTNGSYNAAYVQDTWRINRFVTALIGWRHEQERVNGSPISGERAGYSFTGQWAPRLGVTVDPFGKGKTKAFYNFGRFFEYLPLDAAERALSSEQDFTGARFAPEYTVDQQGNRRIKVNQFGTVTPVVDAAHLLCGAGGGIEIGSSCSFNFSIGNPFGIVAPGTKLGYTNENTFGVEQQLPGNMVFSARYIDRRLKRILEDAASVSPEAALAGVGQVYYIGNVSKKLDNAVNLQPFKYATGAAIPAGCVKNAQGAPVYGANITDASGKDLGNVCYGARGIDATGSSINLPDGQPDGFPDPERVYRAVELELNKRFSKGWQLLSNWRIASLRGNYEGHLRNDNNQTDPGISSLFDFTAGDFNLLGAQFSNGPLNTDRRHVVNVYGSYAFGQEGPTRMLKGLNLGAGLHMESGVPVSEYLAQPVYANAGEVPVGGRGSLGRTPFYSRLDLHSDYSWNLNERWKFTLVGDFFNVTNNRAVRLYDQFRESQAGQQNPDFLKPFETAAQLRLGYHAPFNMRLGLKLEF
jgi:hypothetical protein